MLLYSILIWIVLGLIAGVIASFIMKSGFGIVGDIIVGILGALIGGFIANSVFNLGVQGGLNIPSIIVAVVGAIILIALLRLFSRGRATRV